MAEVRTLDLGGHEVGYEWRAGNTPPGDSAPGYWLVRKEEEEWVVLFRTINKVEYTIHTFRLTEDGEKAAKDMALRIISVAWGRYD